MSVNNTACSPSGTCTILDGTITNGTMFVAQYNPDAPIYSPWRPKLELAVIIIANCSTLLVILSRLSYRWMRFKRFRWDDRWMAVAAFVLVPYTVSQIGTNRYGSGLHFVNVPKPWRELHWKYMIGWCGYWIVTSCIKLSACCCFLGILPSFLKGLRISTYALCGLISALGLTMTFSWLFDCKPVLSNFEWSVLSDSCVNYDIFRWLWIGVSIPIDMVIMYIPLHILKRANLRTHERRILKMVFSATLLGTVTCAAGIYAVYVIRTATANDGFYEEAAWIMMNDIEIFMYTLGASFPVLSNYIVQRTDPGAQHGHENFSSWARYIPNFFTTNNPPTELTSNSPPRSIRGLQSSVKILHTAPSSLHTIPSGTESKAMSEGSGCSEGGDLEKGEGRGIVVSEEVSVESLGIAREVIVGKYMNTTQIIGDGW